MRSLVSFVLFAGSLVMEKTNAQYVFLWKQTMAQELGLKSYELNREGEMADNLQGD
jgi:hypothetical protein